MSERLNFGNDDLAGFDATPVPQEADLAGFDSATGTLTVPAGPYLCRIDRGELTTTKAGKNAYRLKFVIVEPTEHAEFVLWRWFVLSDPASLNRAKAALAPLGIVTSAHLRGVYPPIGCDVFVNALVTVRPAKDGYPESNDVERFAPCEAPASYTSPPANPFAVPLDDLEGGSQG